MVWPVLATLLSLLVAPYLLAATAEAAALAYLRALEAPALARAPLLPPQGPVVVAAAEALHRAAEAVLLPLLGLGRGRGRRPGRPAHARAALLALRRHAVLRGVARVKKWIYLAYLVLRLGLACLGWAAAAGRRLHDALRDERFLVGMELQNRGEGAGVVVEGAR